MTEPPEARPVRGRFAKQERSERTRRAIAEAVIAVLAERGLSGLTHRLVAQRAGASLAATTYYYQSKGDMVGDASNELFRLYLAQFTRAAERVHGGGPAGYLAFVAHVCSEGVGTHARGALAWFEIIFDGARDEAVQNLSRTWFERLEDVWVRIADAFGMSKPMDAARCGIDLTIGALIHGLSLGLTGQDLGAALTGRGPAENVLGRAAGPEDQHAHKDRLTGKAARTRQRLLEAAIHLLAEGGAAAVTYRAVALRAGCSRAAPAYHFLSSAELLTEAQLLLNVRAKARYRQIMNDSVSQADLETMIELTAVIFQREATEFRAVNLAGYAIWTEAARRPEVRPVVERVLADFYQAWRKRFVALGAASGSLEALLVQFLFVGAQVRVFATGVTPNDLVRARAGLRDDIAALAQRRHWVQEGQLVG